MSIPLQGLTGNGFVHEVLLVLAAFAPKARTARKVRRLTSAIMIDDVNEQAVIACRRIDRRYDHWLYTCISTTR